MTSYEFYKSEFFGNLISDEEWQKFSNLAFKQVDFYTFGRVSKVETTPKEVDFCVCEVAEYLYQGRNVSNGITSESTDGHSVTYEKKTQSQIDEDIWYIILKNLANTGLLYPGTRLC